MYQAQQFANLAGVTVRSLHYYDRLGLLKPARRSARGYRLYTDRDLARLEQIVVLKYLGLPLKQIRSLLRKESDLSDVLWRQQATLATRRRQLDQTIQAIQAAARSFNHAQEPDWSLFKKSFRRFKCKMTTTGPRNTTAKKRKPRSPRARRCGHPTCRNRSARIGRNSSPISKRPSTKIQLAPRPRHWPRAGANCLRASPEATRRFKKA